MAGSSSILMVLFQANVGEKLILPVYVLITYFYVYHYADVLLHDRLSTLNTQQAVWFCFPGMTSSLAKSKQIIVAHF